MKVKVRRYTRCERKTAAQARVSRASCCWALIVAICLILLALSVAAPKVALELRREREVEAVRRGDQYVRAIRMFYLKNQHYPGSMEQLEKTNNIRFLRQQYVDPMTGKADWRLIARGAEQDDGEGIFRAAAGWDCERRAWVLWRGCSRRECRDLRRAEPRISESWRSGGRWGNHGDDRAGYSGNWCCRGGCDWCGCCGAGRHDGHKRSCGYERTGECGGDGESAGDGPARIVGTVYGHRQQRDRQLDPGGE